MGDISIKIQIGGFAVEVSGPQKYAEKKFAELLGKYGPVRQGQEAPATGTGKSKGKPVSPSEFIKKLKPKNQTERTLALAYFMEKQMNLASFTTTEIVEINKTAKQSPFTNISDTVAKAVSQGLMMGAGEKDNKRTYALTTTGEESVEAALSPKD